MRISGKAYARLGIAAVVGGVGAGTGGGLKRRAGVGGDAPASKPQQPAAIHDRPTMSAGNPPGPRALKNQFIIGFAPGTTPADRARIVRGLGGTITREIPFIDAVVVQVKGATASSASRWANKEPAIVWAQPDFVHPHDEAARRSRTGPAAAGTGARTADPNDPLFNKQWNLRNTGGKNRVKGADIGATEAWKLSTGKGVIVAVTDTRINISHPDLAGNVWTNPGEIVGNKVDDDSNGYVDDIHGWSFGEGWANVEEGAPWDHGTHVAGTVAAVTDNRTGIAGVAPNAKIMALPVAGSRGTISSNGIEAFAYAADHGAKVVNASWGNHIYEPALAAATRKLAERDVLLVVAAGNGWEDTGANPSYPDNYPGAMSVAASNPRDRLERESNWGTATVDIAAPGEEILSTTLLIDPYSEMTGTSMAAPHVAGVAALVKSHYPQLTMAQVGERILRSAQRDGSASGWRRLVSSGGRLDAPAALMPIGEPQNITVRAGGSPSAPPNSTTTARAGAALVASWKSNVLAEQRFDVELTTNAAALGAVDENFERAQLRRPADLALSAGPGRNRFQRTQGAGTNGSWALRSTLLGRGHYARVDLHETVVQPTTLSFDVRGRGSLKSGALSVFVNGELQFEPRKPKANWNRIEVPLPPGEHTIAIIASRPSFGIREPVGFDLDNVRIGQVSDAVWRPAGTSNVGATSIALNPDTATGAAALRVRANNGRWSGPWVQSEPFVIAPAGRT